MELVVRTGGVDLYPAGASIDSADYLDAMDACGVGYDVLDAAEAAGRWPALRLDPGTTVVHQADTGLVRATAANAAHRALAAANGASLLDRTPVEAVEPDATGGFTVVAGGDRFAVDRLIVAADGWTNDVVAGLGWSVNLVVTQEQVAYFAPRSASGRDPGVDLDGRPRLLRPPFRRRVRVKIGQDVGGATVTAEDRSFDPDPGYRDRLVRFQESLLPGTAGAIVEERTCLYTMTPDREFVIDRVPGHEDAFVALGAAHGFKFAGVFGKILAELAIDGVTDHDVSGWPATRPILTEPDPALSFLL